MKITVSQELDVTKNILVLGAFEDKKDTYASLNKDLAKDLVLAHKEKEFEGKFGEAFSTKIASLPYRHVAVFGLGKKKELTIEKYRRILGKVVSFVKGKKKTSFTTNLPLVVCDQLDHELLGRATSEGLLLADYSFIKYLSKERQAKKKPLASVTLQWKNSKNGFGKGLKVGKIIADCANFTRDLVNEPAGVANSLYLERMARKVAASSSKIKLKVLNEPQMKKLGMGCLLGVNAGSKNPAKLLFLEYNGAGKSEKPYALVGKGITFDSGGYNLKPTKYIEDMHTDMGGSAAVLGTIKAAAALGVKKNIVGVMGICENMVDSTAQHPGDIVTAYNGKTVQIGNTDAEGRLVLADALAYTQKKYNPAQMMSFATLTGACVVALGYYAAAIMGRDETQLGRLKSAGMASGDRVWPMPFFDDYQDWMDGSVSDLNNIAQKGKGYEAGSITAGVFLSKFVDTDKTSWAHFDIAGSASWSVTGDYFEKGATGSGVRVMCYYLLEE